MGPLMFHAWFGSVARSTVDLSNVGHPIAVVVEQDMTEVIHMSEKIMHGSDYVLEHSRCGGRFPMHEACLTMLNRLIFHRHRWSNESRPQTSRFELNDAYAAMYRQFRRYWHRDTWDDDGIEWEHGYYGPRQFWNCEWPADRRVEVCISSLSYMCLLSPALPIFRLALLFFQLPANNSSGCGRIL